VVLPERRRSLSRAWTEVESRESTLGRKHERDDTGFDLVVDADLHRHPVSFSPEYERLPWHDFEVDRQSGVSDRLERLGVCSECFPIDQDIDVTVLSANRTFKQRLFCDASEHPDGWVQFAELRDGG
jgi:hypothetical protein